MQDKVLNLLKEKPLQTYEDLMPSFNDDEINDLANVLTTLENEYKIMHNKKNQFATLAYFNLAYGVIDVKDKGFAFVDTDEQGIFIPKDKINKALSKDEVIISTKVDALGRLEGEVIRIVKRNTLYIYGYVSVYKKKYYLTSIDPSIKMTFIIDKEDQMYLKRNDLIKAKIMKFYDDFHAQVKLIKIIGDKDSVGSDIQALIYASGINTNFSEETLLEIKGLSDVVKKDDLVNRVSLLDKQIITIDGDDAKDLDDAISVKKLPNGNYELGVYIADVSHYVLEDTFLDHDAKNRGTSVYLPDRVIPMLPKELSNGLCSLNEGVIRLVLACVMEINEKGEIVNQDIFEGYIKSLHRMTYKNVNLIFEGAHLPLYDDINDLLFNALDLASILHQKRVKRGAFNFEADEVKLILNEDGKVSQINKRERGISENIIEEFMLICNECIATTLFHLDVPTLYRVHDEPEIEKVNSLISFVNSFNHHYQIKGNKTQDVVLKQILNDFDPTSPSLTPEEISLRMIVNKELIRSMAKARYQAFNIGHYGLASPCYVHFTSPIRRYPDLIIHRLIKEFLLNISTTKSSNPITHYNKLVTDLGPSLSKLERNAEKLERDCVNFKLCEYLKSFIGEVFSGTISSITNFGIFTTLDNTCEGLTRYEDMHDDYYDVDLNNKIITGLKHGKRYKLGDRVKVAVMDVNILNRQVDFKLIRKDIQ